MLQIQAPYVVVISGDLTVLVNKADIDRLQEMTTQAQVVRGGIVGPVQSLQVIYKFLYDFTEVVPPQPWGRHG